MSDRKTVLLVDYTGQVWAGGNFTAFQLESLLRKYRRAGVILSVKEYIKSN